MKNLWRIILLVALLFGLNVFYTQPCLAATETLRPDAAGDETSITSQQPSSTFHWDKVDEVSADDSTTFVYTSSASYLRDLFNFPAHSIGSGAISSVTIYFRIEGVTGTGYAKPSQKSNTTVTDGTEVSQGSTSWSTKSQIYYTNPATGSAYTWPEIDNLQVGVSLKNCSCTQVYFVVNYTPGPTVTTQAATSITDTTATGNGNITSTGGVNCTIRGFDWDTNSGEPYANSVTENGSFGTGAYSLSLISLPPGATIYYRAKAYNGAWGYGSETTFVTKGPPSITTSAASNVEETTATLNGNITLVNNGSCSVRGFDWDTDSGAPYTNNWYETGSFGTGAFSHDITTLTKGELYYYRAYATNIYGTGYGSEQTLFTKPDEPSGFTATATSGTQISLSWSKGTGAQKTYIRRKEGDYPTDKNDGSLVYNDTGTGFSDSGLSQGHTYYYRAWSYATEGTLEQYSDGYTSAYATTFLTLKLYIVYECSATFTDQSGYGNNATPTFRTTSSDADVSASLSNFRPIHEAELTGYGGAEATPPDILATSPALPSESYTEGQEYLPGSHLINTLLDAAGIPRGLFWIPFVFGMPFLFIVFGWALIKSMFIWQIIGGVWILVFGLFQITPLMPFFLLLPMAAAICVMERFWSW
jgi:hypothetical protein